jgi:protein-S-isoprenylcysteine O-methyltransferase Ste14
MFNSLFKISYFIGFVLAFLIRKIYTSKKSKSTVQLQKKSILEQLLLVLVAIGMIITIIYVFSTVLDFANYSLPNWIGWLGSVLFVLALCLLRKSHLDLGEYWTVRVTLHTDHKLITSGLYKHIRHPMYAAHLLWAIAQIMILHNWIAGYSFLIVQIPFYILRIRNEEKMMIEQFGADYELYMEKTYRFIPKIY